MFDKKLNIPCVGLSIGVERLYKIIEKRILAGGEKKNRAFLGVFVASAQRGFLEERLKLCQELWDADIMVCFKYIV